LIWELDSKRMMLEAVRLSGNFQMLQASLPLLLFFQHVSASASCLIPALTCAKTYSVKLDQKTGEPEKLYDIAKKHNMTMAELIKENRQFQAKQKLYENETLCVVNLNSNPVSYSLALTIIELCDLS
jgi:hypothetical protein